MNGSCLIHILQIKIEHWSMIYGARRVIFIQMDIKKCVYLTVKTSPARARHTRMKLMIRRKCKFSIYISHKRLCGFHIYTHLSKNTLAIFAEGKLWNMILTVKRHFTILSYDLIVDIHPSLLLVYLGQQKIEFRK